MSAKYFCDVCEGTMVERDMSRFKRKLGDVEIEIMSAFKDGWNSGHICHSCILNVVHHGAPVK